MDFKKAVTTCHVRSAIYRTIDPTKRYYKNHTIKLEDRVPIEDQKYNDWEEYDPRDDDDCSLFMFND